MWTIRGFETFLFRRQSFTTFQYKLRIESKNLIKWTFKTTKVLKPKQSPPAKTNRTGWKTKRVRTPSPCRSVVVVGDSKNRWSHEEILSGHARSYSWNHVLTGVGGYENKTKKEKKINKMKNIRIIFEYFVFMVDCRLSTSRRVGKRGKVSTHRAPPSSHRFIDMAVINGSQKLI